MTEEEKDYFTAYRIEYQDCGRIALELDTMFPDTPNAFYGTPSERIKRQLVEIFKLLDDKK